MLGALRCRKADDDLAQSEQDERDEIIGGVRARQHDHDKDEQHDSRDARAEDVEADQDRVLEERERLELLCDPLSAASTELGPLPKVLAETRRRVLGALGGLGRHGIAAAMQECLVWDLGGGREILSQRTVPIC